MWDRNLHSAVPEDGNIISVLLAPGLYARFLMRRNCAFDLLVENLRSGLILVALFIELLDMIGPSGDLRLANQGY